MNVWSELGIEPTDDRAAIRRAYARRLKLNRPDQDPVGFERLRAAYEIALSDAEALLDDAVLDTPSPPAPTDRRSRARALSIDSRGTPPPAESSPFSVRHADGAVNAEPNAAHAADEPHAEEGQEADVDVDVDVGAKPAPGPDPDPEPEPEPEREPDAAELAERLWEALHARNSDLAVRLFVQLVAHDSMADFESRWGLERWLLSTLADGPTPSPRFIAVVALEFRWREDATHVPDGSRDLVDELLAELELADILEELEPDGGGWLTLTRFTRGRKHIARWLLGGPHRPLWLDYFSLSAVTFKYLQAQWREVDVFGADALSRQLGREKYEWWNANVENGPGWFLALVQKAQRLVFTAVALTAIYCAAILPNILTERITGSSIFFAIYVPYVGITFSVPLLLHVVLSAASVALIRGQRRLRAMLERPIAALERGLASLARGLPLDRYHRWQQSLSPGWRRIVDLVFLVFVACAVWVVLLGLLWIDHT